MKKLTIVLLAVFASLAVLSSCGTAKKTETDYRDAFLVDVRTPGEFAEGSAPGAVNIPLDELEARLDEFGGKEKIVVFCRSGNRSRQAKSLLDSKGLKGVIDGGTYRDVTEMLQAGK